MKGKKSKEDIFARLGAHSKDSDQKKLDSNPKNSFTGQEFCDHEGLMKSAGLARLRKLVTEGKIKHTKLWMIRGDGQVYLGVGYTVVEEKGKGRK